ncbi:alpha/beta hydrolase family protein [Pedobacter nutrimenti]|uniref:Cephalosporin-C deacetylase-like acetyl esterase n=1 Tax=Pedobacter nutrimenti TaxID=1241337 RepID=A0A318UAZ0_9SPHI|nr:alpha/beta fold hydrolase [Pedobacter nutrimenti]PYF72392.1 cephalosporin-C deacetylase-like acetyl esterase [Pedobacter nutrimenti]
MHECIKVNLVLILLWCSYTRSYGQFKGSLWDVKEIAEKPFYKTVSSDSAIGMIYQGLSYKGHRKNIFAWYASPATIKGKQSENHQFPAVVLVHGGGGTAFKQWAILWAKKGYAAIAMDLRGNDADKKHIEGGFEEPDGKTPYFTIPSDLRDSWMYQAVADVILAHNLIRSFPEVDSNRTALTGISWGGIITTLLAGLDDRFKAAVPVYGCGYLFYDTAMKKDLDLLSDQDKDQWIRAFDPSRYLGRSKMPVLFINGTNDGHFFLDAYARTYRLATKKSLSIKIGLKHNHAHGWGNQEIYDFIGHELNGTPALPVFGPLKTTKKEITVQISSPVPLRQAFLNYTLDHNSPWKAKQWEKKPVRIENQHLFLEKPSKETLAWFLSVEDERGLEVSSEIQFGTSEPE